MMQITATWWSSLVERCALDTSIQSICLTWCDKILHWVKSGAWFPLYHPCLSALEVVMCPCRAPLQPGVMMTFASVLAV